MTLVLYNTLTRKKEKFAPISPPNVGMYTCGPTVYDFASIGNFRTYTTADILLRVLKFNNFQVNYIMNLTDVGHLTGDNQGDADTGEDRLVKAAKKERKTAWDVADFYTQAFLEDFKKLNLTNPQKFTKATDHISEQINLVTKLEEKALTYKTSDGIYFDTVSFEKNTGKKYGELSTLDMIREGARVDVNIEKKNPRDFALWKFSPKNEKRDMEWESPWGIGFPGWHIECSAMSMKYLGESFDIHTGGEDLRSTHHPNEIAQAEGATGKDFVKYWIHGAFLKVDGKRMGKSLGNFYTVSDLEKKGFEPLSLRHFYLTGKYNEPLNFTWEALSASQNSLNKLREQVLAAKLQTRTVLSAEKSQKIDEFTDEFTKSINDDLNTPQALAVLWSALKSNIPSEDKYDLAVSFDQVLGLKLDNIKQEVLNTFTSPKGIEFKTPLNFLGNATIIRLESRDQARISGDYVSADKFRDEIKEKDKLDVKDSASGTIVYPLKKGV